jgi:hypothetical protein
MNPIKTTPKDFFLHLGALVTLYASIIALSNLIFSVINYLIPDKLAGYFYANSVAWPISTLIILVPLLYIFEWLIVKEFSVSPEKKDLPIRRWRIHLTLFLTGLTIAIALISLINVYLNGEIGWRFAWKVIAIMLITGAVFKYYFFSIYENFRWSRLSRKVNAWFGILLVVAAIVAGFIVVGSPAHQRALRFDNQRVSDLQNIQWQVLNYWQQKSVLPTNLDSLKDSLSGNIVPTDPETKKPYEYAVKSTTSFELCATFLRKVEDKSGRGGFMGRGYYDMTSPIGYLDENWKHEAGRTCFTRTIDPERYPPYPAKR